MGEITTSKRFKIGNKAKKIIAGIACTLLVLIVAGGLVFSCIVGKQVAEGLFYQNAGKDTKGNSIKQLEKWGYDWIGFEASYQSEKLSIKAEDGNIIPVTLLSVDDNLDKNTAIIVHGAGGDHVSTYPQAEIYLKNNWNVITFDQRASGDSKNEYVTFGYFEKLDLKALVDYVKETTSDKKVVVHGVSMGAATTGLYLETEHAAEHLNYAVLDSSYDSMESMFLGVWHGMDTGIPDNYVIGCGNWYIKTNHGFKFEDVDIVKAVANNEVPTLVIQGTKDKLCTQDMGERIFEAIATNNKKMWLVNSAHIEACIDDPEAYENNVMSFLGK